MRKSFVTHVKNCSFLCSMKNMLNSLHYTCRLSNKLVPRAFPNEPRLERKMPGNEIGQVRFT